ncbi:MAG: YibE/F family protein, partial [Thermotaleaceae bacterium]
MIKKYRNILLISMMIISISAVMFFSKGFGENRRGDIHYEKAKIIDILNEKLREDTVVPGIFLGYQELELEITTGEFAGNRFKVRNAMSRLYNVQGKKNMEIIVQIYAENHELQSISVYNYFREPVIYILIVLFFAVLLIFGRIKGLKAIISLIFTGVMVIFLMLPLIFRGTNPILASILTVSLTTFATLLLVSGFNRKTMAAALGTICGVICAGIIAYITGNIVHLSGLTMEEAEALISIAERTGLQIRGLMFAGILIASMGAIMDVGMSIASAIFEIKNANPQFSKSELIRSGMNIGQDIMGTMSNTLILAFAGGSLNIMLIIMAYGMPYRQIMNLDLICTELIQG